MNKTLKFLGYGSVVTFAIHSGVISNPSYIMALIMSVFAMGIFMLFSKEGEEQVSRVKVMMPDNAHRMMYIHGVGLQSKTPAYGIFNLDTGRIWKSTPNRKYFVEDTVVYNRARKIYYKDAWSHQDNWTIVKA